MFSTIQDAVDTNITIIRHDQTGNYNITKTLNQYNEIHGTKKKIKYWNETQDGKDTRAAAIELYGNDAIYELRENTQNEHMGTYVNPDLYRAILMWADKGYAFKIFAIIRKHQEEYQRKLEFENGAFQSAFGVLLNKMDELGNKFDVADKRAVDAEFSLEKLNKGMDTVVSMLQEKSIVSTMNPTNPKLHHNFVIMGYQFTHAATGKTGWVLAFIAGQELNVKKAIRKKYADEDHAWIIVVQMHYNANPIDLRNNIETKINEFIASRVLNVNEKNRIQIESDNETLKEEIRAYMSNKQPDEPKRLYSQEKKKFIKLTIGQIPITCKKTRAVYIGNDHIEYDEFLNTITGVNEETQKSPFQSETSDAESSKAEDGDSE